MRLASDKQLVQGTVTVGPKTHQDEEEQDLGKAGTESPEGRQRSPGDSPDPQNRSIRCQNFSCICDEGASSARHSTCLLTC